LKRVLTDETFYAQLSAEAGKRTLPTWAAAAEMLQRAFASS
jgi:hypothetical protein